MIHKAYPNHSAALTTAGGLLFTGLIDGSLAAYDDTSLEQLWEINVGTGFNGAYDPQRSLSGQAHRSCLRHCVGVMPMRAAKTRPKEELMSGNGMRSPCRFSARAIPFSLFVAGFISPAIATNNGSSIPDLSGQSGRDMLFFRTAAFRPRPRHQGQWLGDHSSPIRKPEAAEIVKKLGDLSFSGTVMPDLHNTCWPEPPPFVLGTHFGVQILQLRDEPKPQTGAGPQLSEFGNISELFRMRFTTFARRRVHSLPIRHASARRGQCHTFRSI